MRDRPDARAAELAGGGDVPLRIRNTIIQINLDWFRGVWCKNHRLQSNQFVGRRDEEEEEEEEEEEIKDGENRG